VDARPVRIGLLGCGNVGAALVELVRSRRADIAARLGLDLEVVRVAVRSATKERSVDVAPAELTTDALAVATAPDIDVIVEVIGGIEPARELILEALKAGKPVVTANKELLANHGAELFAAADAAQRDLLFEAAVAGGIPLMRPLRQSLAGEPIHRVMGIVNGTTNYILTKMTEEGASYHAALSEAQRLGYAERDPTADVEGFDAGAKAAIIAMVAFGVRVVAGDVYHEGISSITQSDIDVARRLGYRIKLLAVVERFDSDDRPEVAVRVHPAMVPETHPLAAVRDSFNAVFVEGGAAGDLMFYGRGAGGAPTSSAVLGDVIDAASNLHRNVHAGMGVLSRPRVRPIDDLQSAYYLSLDVVDRPGVLAAVATVFGAHGVSIRSMEQIGLADEARLILITHSANERDFHATLRDLRGLEAVRHVGSLMRVIGE
jgi:homoserine dehydrogenase